MPDQSLGYQVDPPQRHFRFGPFLVDSRSGELRKHGIKLRIGQQSLRVLLMLLEHPGEVVLREDIRVKLWPNDTVVEFDHSINAAIQKLRAALGESAGSPLYIETLARRGYRFVGTVEAPDHNGTAPTESPRAVLGQALSTAGTSTPAVLTPTVGTRAKRFAGRLLPAGAALVLAGVVLVALHPWKGREPARNWSFSLGTIDRAAVSPDGSTVIYNTPAGVKLRHMNSLDETVICPGQSLADIPVWSEDGSQVLLVLSRSLVKLPLPNGPPVTVGSLSNASRGIAWSSKGTILVTKFDARLETGHLNLFPLAGGEPTHLEIPQLTGGMFFVPEFLPDGENFIFAWAAEGEGEAGIYLATLRAGKLVRGPFLLRKNMTAGRFSSWGGGRLLYVQDDTLYAQKLNIASASLDGTPVKVVDHVFSAPTWRDPSVSVSRNGMLLWRSGRASLAEMTWFDRAGKVLGTSGPLGLPWQVRLAPDDKHFAYQAAGGIGVAESNRSGFLPLTGVKNVPFWVGNNSRIMYGWNERDRVRLVERAFEGGPETMLASLEQIGSAFDVSSDGQLLIYHVGGNIYSIRLAGTRAAPQFFTHGNNARLSPDHQWIVYKSDELFVQRFPSGSLPIQISPGKAGYPVWRGDGKEILYIAGSTIYSVPVRMNGAELHAGQPKALFDIRVPAGLTADSSPLAVTRDGSRILFAQGVEQEGSQPTYVMTDWTAALRK